MVLLFIILLVLGGIIFYKTKKIKSLNKDLIKKETMFFELYDQKFTCFFAENRRFNTFNLSLFSNEGKKRKMALFCS